MGIESNIWARYRADVTAYHEERGTLHTQIHSARAAKAKFEVPYFFEARRLEREMYIKGMSEIKPTKIHSLWLIFKIIFSSIWIRVKGWIKIYMPLTYFNLNLINH